MMAETYVTDTDGASYAMGGDRPDALAASMLLEAADLIEDGYVIGGDAPATYTGGPWYHGFFYTNLRDRSDGRYLPYYEDEMDLRRMRSACRRLATFSSIVVGLRSALEVYTVGGQWKYKAAAREGRGAPQGLVDAVQRVIDDNLERNDFVGELDREIHNSYREDGDAPVGIYPSTGGLSDWRRLDADHLTEPHSTHKLNRWLNVDGRASWTFGVLTLFDERQRRVDHTRHAGYHFVFNDSGTEWDYLPSWPQHGLPGIDGKCGVLFKRNTPREAKRGLSDYLPVQVDLEREAKLTENLGVGAAILAAIPWIEQLPEDVGQDEVSNTLDEAWKTFASKATQSSRRSSGRSLMKIKPGTIPTVNKGREYIAGPMGQTRQPIYMEVAQHYMRRAGVAFASPEYMISGDASNAAFASTLVAESPFVKARQSDQDNFIRYTKALNWRALKIAFDAGRFAKWASTWEKFRAMIELQIEGPEVASRDKAALVAELNGAFDRGLIDGNEYRRALDREEQPEYEGVTGSGVAIASPGVLSPMATGGAHPESESAARRRVQFSVLEGRRRE